METALILRIAMTFLPILMRLAEKLFSKEKSGAEKKDFVIKELPVITNAIGGIVTGGAKETWDTINAHKDTFSEAIDITAELIFPKLADEDHAN